MVAKKKRQKAPTRDPQIPRDHADAGPREAVKFVLRLDPKLHKKIKKHAKTHNTSMNKYIENGLVEVVSNEKFTLPELFKRLEEKKVI